jgi:hypothetical protein
MVYQFEFKGGKRSLWNLDGNEYENSINRDYSDFGKNVNVMEKLL